MLKTSSIWNISMLPFIFSTHINVQHLNVHQLCIKSMEMCQREVFTISQTYNHKYAGSCVFPIVIIVIFISLSVFIVLWENRGSERPEKSLTSLECRQVVSLWTCSKLCAVCFVAGVFVGYTLKRRVRRWASRLLRRLKDDWKL